MTTSKSNIEAMAREICAREIAGRMSAEELRVAVDRFWPVVAAEIEAGIIDENGIRKQADVEQGLAAYRDWLERHGRARAI